MAVLFPRMPLRFIQVTFAGFVGGCLRANWVCYLNGLVACIPNAFASLTGHTEQARTVLGFTCERIFVFVGACLHANEACYFNWFYRLRASSYRWLRYYRFVRFGFCFVGACLHANGACYFNWGYRLLASSNRFGLY